LAAALLRRKQRSDRGGCRRSHGRLPSSEPAVAIRDGGAADMTLRGWRPSSY